MTLDQAIRRLDTLQAELTIHPEGCPEPWRSWLVEAHEAMCQVIEQLNSIISKWKDTYAGQKELLEQLSKELELLKQDDAERCTLIRDMEEEERKKDVEIDMLREALQLLYDVQNGCPLPTYQKDWDRAMELTQQALKNVKE